MCMARRKLLTKLAASEHYHNPFFFGTFRKHVNLQIALCDSLLFEFIPQLMLRKIYSCDEISDKQSSCKSKRQTFLFRSTYCESSVVPLFRGPSLFRHCRCLLTLFQIFDMLVILRRVFGVSLLMSIQGSSLLASALLFVESSLHRRLFRTRMAMRTHGRKCWMKLQERRSPNTFAIFRCS
jgi:hypothetical protein